MKIVMFLISLGISCAQASTINFTVRNSNGDWSANGPNVIDTWINEDEIVIKVDTKCQRFEISGDTIGHPTVKKYTDGIGITFTKRNEWDQYVRVSPSNVPSQSFQVIGIVWQPYMACTSDEQWSIVRNRCERREYSNVKMSCSNNGGGRTAGEWPNCHYAGGEP